MRIVVESINICNFVYIFGEWGVLDLTDRHRYRPLSPAMVVGGVASYRPHQVCSVYTFGIRNYKLTLIHIRPNFVLSGRRRALLSFSVYRSEIEERAAKL